MPSSAFLPKFVGCGLMQPPRAFYHSGKPEKRRRLKSATACLISFLPVQLRHVGIFVVIAQQVLGIVFDVKCHSINLPAFGVLFSDSPHVMAHLTSLLNADIPRVASAPGGF